MMNKKGIFAIAGVIGLVALIAFAGNRFVNKNSEDGAPIVEEHPTPPNIMSSSVEPNNPTDYSQMQAGEVFYDEYWHGTVTIVGKEGELEYSYQQLIDKADGRLIATQDGMTIFVEFDELHTVDYDEDAVQNYEYTVEPVPEDEEFYKSVPVEIDYQDNFPSYAAGELFPACGWKSLHYAVKQYLTDTGLENVQTLTFIPKTVSFSDFLHGFQCSMDAAEGEIGLYFDTTTGMWKFNNSTMNDGKSYMAYSPVDFVSPSTKDQAREELNKIVGYEKF